MFSYLFLIISIFVCYKIFTRTSKDSFVEDAYKSFETDIKNMAGEMFMPYITNELIETEKFAYQYYKNKAETRKHIIQKTCVGRFERILFESICYGDFIYRGKLGPTNLQRYKLYKKLLDYAVENGYCTTQVKDELLETLDNEIATLG